MRLTSLLLLSWFITSGHLLSQIPPSSLPLLYSAHTGRAIGFAVKVGERIIGVTNLNNITERQYDWTLLGEKQGWKFDATKMIRPMQVGYYPFVENRPPPSVVVYNPVFSLADGEPLILHDGHGATLQGNFIIQYYQTRGYSSDQGFRPLEVRLPKLPKKKNEPNFKVVTKADGKQVVGMVLGESVNGVKFEPLLVGHPVFRGLPTSNATKIFGRAVSPAGANALACWISPEFFPIQVGDNVRPWQTAWRLAPEATHFTIKGGDMRQYYDSMYVNTVAVNAADTKKGRMYDAVFHGHEGSENPNGYDGAGLVNALIDAFGDPSEASYFTDNRDDLVVMRFNMTASADFLVSIGPYGPARSSLRKAGASFRLVEQGANAKEAKLATTRKDLQDALVLLKKPRK